MKLPIAELAWAVLCVVGLTSPLNATLIQFVRLSNNSPSDLAAQLKVDVTDPGSDQVDFTFYNEVGTPSSITDVYFDDGTLLGIATIFSSSGVSFSQGASPMDLPGGGNASPPFQVTQGFSADSDPPASSNGVNSAVEWLTVRFNLINAKTVADTLSALADGSLRIGIHVQSIAPSGDSDSYITPEPSGALLTLLGVSMGGWRRRRSRI